MPHASRRPRGPVQPPLLNPAASTSTGLPVPMIGVSVPSQSFGVSNPQQWSDQVLSYDMAVRVRSNTVMSFLNLYDAWPSGLAKVAASGRKSLLTLQPYTSQGPLAMDLAGIMAGSYDSVIATFATNFAGMGAVRGPHEMNTADYPWGQAIGATAYIALWNKLRSVWRAAETAAGAPHAPWLWCPNIGNSGSFPFTAYYPGDGACEFVGLDGYSYALVGFPTFASVFGADLTALASLAPTKPIIIGETGCSNDNTSRAAWITGMFSYLQTVPAVKGFDWFEHGIDLIEGYQADCAAMRAGVAAWAPGVA